MLELALKNVWKRKTRSILTVLGIVVALQLYLIMSSIMNQYEQDIKKQVSGIAGKVLVQMKTESGRGSFYPLDSVIKQSDAEKVEKLQDVDQKRSSMLAFQEIVPTSVPNMPPEVLGVGIEPGKEEAYYGDIKIKGSGTLKSENDVILGKNAAAWAEDKFNAGIGDTVKVKNKKFKIIGILPSVSSSIDSSFIMPLITAQDIFVRPQLVNAIFLTASDTNKVDELASRIQKDNSRLMASTSKDMQKSADEILKGQRVFFAMINDTIVVVAAFIIMIVMVMAVNERKKEIGTLKAIGASRWRVLGMIIAESLTLSLIGGILSVPASMIFIKLLMKVWFFDFSQWLQTIIVAVILGVISGLWPAWSAQRVNPLESLRYE
ncbi:MAG TPA: FtsX-like permease family protein [Clostridia bacterium]|nr:FtsX-like permease family protein [Clostridia bacterium]